MQDVGSLTIAAGVFGSVSVSVLVMLLVELVKAYAPGLSGRSSEVAVTLVSLAAVSAVLVSTRADWYSRDTYLALAIGTAGVNVLARGLYAKTSRA